MAILRTDLERVPPPQRRPDGHVPEMNYDWANWSDGNVWELFPDADFHVGYGSFSTIAHNYARRHGMRAEIRKLADGGSSSRYTVLIQFIPLAQDAR